MDVVKLVGEHNGSYKGVGKNGGHSEGEGSTEDKGHCERMFVHSQSISQANKT